MSRPPILPPGLPPHIAQHTLDNWERSPPPPILPQGLPPDIAQHALNIWGRQPLPPNVGGIVKFIIIMRVLFALLTLAFSVSGAAFFYWLLFYAH